jgi:hypothetical protein
VNEHLHAENQYEHKLSSHPIFRTIGDAEIDKYLALRDRKLAKTPEPIPIVALASPRSLSFDRRNQLSASAIQRARLVGSCLASFLHSAARELNSN